MRAGPRRTKRNPTATSKRLHSYAVTDAAVHDSQVFEALLDQTVDEDGHQRALYADSA